jgi:hypothetical protein
MPAIREFWGVTLKLGYEYLCWIWIKSEILNRSLEKNILLLLIS